MRNLVFLIAVSVSTFFAAAQPQPQLNLMPMPSTVRIGSGQWVIDQSFSVTVTGFHDASLDRAIRRFVAQLSRQTGIPFRPKSGTPTLEVHVDHAREAVQRVDEDESYELTITDSGGKLAAPNPLGVLRGLQTYLQLVQITTTGFAVPAVTIQDQPRFRWRGLLIDVSRHFIPPDALKRNLDAMAAVKMNVLHWHLSDDQGFRVESKKFPRLHEMGADGLYYTQDEIRDLISYAHDRGIRVVPEFDLPGHSRAWFVGYPELSSGRGSYTLESGGLAPIMDPTQVSTYKFLGKFIAEMAALFPDAYFHIGGDEVDGKQWNANPKIQTFIHAHGMKNNQDLQAYFNQRLEAILAKNHKTMVGWDEILHPGLPKTIVVQSWRGQESLATAAKQGYSTLLSSGYYLDLMWPAARHYAIDPMSGAAASLSEEEKNRILGGEACIWAEWVSPENIDSRIWPRNAAVAERLWSPQNVQDANSMYTRLEAVSTQLEWVGLTHKSSGLQMLQRMAGTTDISALRVLFDVVEPVKDYIRWSSLKGPVDFHAPLTRMVDAARPENDEARRFHILVQDFIQHNYKDPVAEAQIRAQLTLWRDNDAKLHDLLMQSFLLHENGPLSANLSAMGTAGLEALDYLDHSQLPPDSWKKQKLALIEEATKPSAGLLLMPVATIQELIQASLNPVSR